ncbi:MAG: DUF5667 domain-containing protein [Methanoregula sp.]|jgi:hypothetical protein|uniref:DUF5667 domain-containing protein n=1 Tax=Methanoregula sp. TaxID=2052170 RepID=UPI0025DCA397|nr:DUF5667 domain-containing protein [Methanoregula sp.]MCK9632171.1 DUF5667 domain-containing protein [Methanoregula sp.]
MIKKAGWINGIFVLALLCMAGTAAALEDTGTERNGTVIADDIEPYNGSIGPGSPLYGLKIAFEDLDESFTTNETELFNKQMANARLRLSEVRRELQLNNSADADRALDLYAQKTNLTRLHLQTYAASNATGLLHAQEMVAKHQLVLADLLDGYPDNTGLMRAYNNSLTLEEKFEEKTQTRFERVTEKNNATVMKAVRLEIRDQQSTKNAGEEQALQEQVTQQVQQGTGNGKDNGKGQARVTEVPPTPGRQTAGTAVTVLPSRVTDDKGNGKSGTDNSASNGGGNGSNGNSGSSATPGTGSGKKP